MLSTRKRLIFICSNVEVSSSDRIMGAWSMTVWDALLEGRNKGNTDGDGINRKYISEICWQVNPDWNSVHLVFNLREESFLFFFIFAWTVGLMMWIHVCLFYEKDKEWAWFGIYSRYPLSRAASLLWPHLPINPPAPMKIMTKRATTRPKWSWDVTVWGCHMTDRL